jgi:hypothetical protein
VDLCAQALPRSCARSVAPSTTRWCGPPHRRRRRSARPPSRLGRGVAVAAPLVVVPPPPTTQAAQMTATPRAAKRWRQRPAASPRICLRIDGIQPLGWISWRQGHVGCRSCGTTGGSSTSARACCLTHCAHSQTAATTSAWSCSAPILPVLVLVLPPLAPPLAPPRQNKRWNVALLVAVAGGVTPWATPVVRTPPNASAPRARHHREPLPRFRRRKLTMVRLPPQQRRKWAA